MSEQPSAERIVCLCATREFGGRVHHWSEWQRSGGIWVEVQYNWADEAHEVTGAAGDFCRWCGAALIGNPEPHAGPSNAELVAALKDLGENFREACMRKIVAEHELAVRERALRLSSEKHGPQQLRAYGEAGERQYHERVAEDVARSIAEARRQLEEEDRASLARQEGGGEC